MFGRLFEKPVKTFEGRLTRPIEIQYYADNMMCGVYTHKARAGTKIELYQYPGKMEFSHLMVGGSKVGDNGIITNVNDILNCCEIL